MKTNKQVPELCEFWELNDELDKEWSLATQKEVVDSDKKSKPEYLALEK